MSCQTEKANDRTIATAYGHHFQLDELDQHLVGAESSIDSQQIIDKEIDNWLMDEILLHEATKQIKNNSEIKSKVQSYEKSLMIHELEKYYIKNALDTTITHQEIDTLYRKHQEDYSITEAIIQCLFVKIPEPQYNDNIKTLWKTEDLPALKANLGPKDDNIHLLDIDNWYQKSRLKNILPQGLWNKINLEKKESYSYSDNGSQYLIKILGHTSKGEPMPMSYATPIIKSRIIRERSQVLLHQWRKDMYQNNIRSKDIIIHTRPKPSNK